MNLHVVVSVENKQFSMFSPLSNKNYNRRKRFTPGTESAEGRFETREPGQRKQWAAAPSDTVLQALANASLMSSDSMTSSTGLTGSTHGSMIYSTNVSHLLKCINIRVFFNPRVFQTCQRSLRRASQGGDGRRILLRGC